VKFDPSTDGPFTCDPLNAQGATAIHISFWCRVHQTEAADFTLYYSGLPNPDPNNPTFTHVPNSDLGGSQQDVWLQYSFTITDPSAFTSTFRFRFYTTLSSFGGQWETVWVDDVLITMDT
jgi:hypothetical protein